jgi:hypothetical protein
MTKTQYDVTPWLMGLIGNDFPDFATQQSIKSAADPENAQNYKNAVWGQCYKTFYGRNLRLFIIN